MKDSNWQLTKKKTQKAKKHMQKCSNSWLIREAQTKTTVGYPFTAVRLEELEGG